MKITKIQIDRFGACRDWSFPLSPSGLSVWYGPNEAGKTTLLRFIQGVLFGFSPELPRESKSAGREITPTRGGALHLAAPSGLLRLERTAAGAACGAAVLIDDAGRAAAGILDQWLNGVDEATFERLYAIGLHELQELGTLNDDAVTQLVYGLTLGPTGQRLLDATVAIRTARTRLIDPLQQGGELVELFERYDRLTAELRTTVDRQREHAALIQRCSALEAEIADSQRRQRGVADQLRGHLYLERAWGPWNRLQECETELDELALVQGFPDKGVERLDRIEAEIAAAAECRDHLQTEVKCLRKQMTSLKPTPELHRHAAAMQAFVGQRSWIEGLQQKMDAAQVAVAAAERELQHQTENLRASGVVQGEIIDPSPAAYHRLASVARSFQAAVSRRQTLRSASRRQRAEFREARDRWAQRCAALGTRTLDTALSDARRDFAGVKTLAELQLRARQLAERGTALARQAEQIAPRMVLPRWVYVILTVFCGMGLILAFSGLITGLIISEIAGTIYGLLGLTCIGVAWGLKTQFEGDARQRFDQVCADATANLNELKTVHDAIGRLTPQIDHLPSASESSSSAVVVCEAMPNDASESPSMVDLQPEPDWADAPFASHAGSRGIVMRQTMLLAALRGVRFVVHTGRVLAREVWRLVGQLIPRRPAMFGSIMAAEASELFDRVSASPVCELALLRNQAQRIADLEQLDCEQRRLRRLRRRFAAVGNRLQIAHREVGTARATWRETLSQAGLADGLSIAAAFPAWNKLQELAEQRRVVRAAKDQYEHLHSLFAAYQQRIEELGRQLQAWDVDYTRPRDVVAAWELQLADLARQVRERRELRAKIQIRQQEAAEYQALVDEYKTQRQALFVQGGAASRDEFEERARVAARRTFLEDQRADAARDLDAAVRAHEDLALVEDDLAEFDAAENSRCIETLRLEADDLDRDLQLARERLDAVRHELDQLERDRRPTELRFEREQVAYKLRQAASQWLGLETAAQLVDHLRSQFERDCQPATLAATSRFLDRLTGGRYCRVWTPINRRQLLVDDLQGTSRPVELLSRATREQLFLSVRLAVIEGLAERGTALPILLDDVFANFDADRTAAAVKLLAEFAGRGRQVLFFTCHLHLAQMFERCGATLINLPQEFSPAAIAA